MQTLRFLTVFCVAWAATAQAAPFAYIANRSSATVSVIDTATDTLVNTIPVGSMPESAAVSPDGKRVYVGHFSSPGYPIKVIDAVTDTVIQTVDTAGASITVAVSPDGTRVYGVGGSSLVKVINTATYALQYVLVGFNYYPQGIAVHPSLARAYVSNAAGSMPIAVVDTSVPSLLTAVTPGANRGVAVHPDGTRVYAVQDGYPSVIRTLYTATNTVDPTALVLSYSAREVAVHPDGTRGYVSGIYGVSVFSTATNLETAAPAVGLDNHGIAVHPDGTRVYVADVDADAVHVIDANAPYNLLYDIPVGVDPYSRGLFIGPIPVCGDGIETFPEECDDGNTEDGDCCSSECELDDPGTPCPNDTVCDGDETCDGAGTCLPGTPPICDDLDICTQDSCDPDEGCVYAEEPRTGCRTAEKSMLLLKDKDDDTKDKLTWKWIKGESTSFAELGDPTDTTDYTLCIYAGSVSAVIAQAAIPASASKWAAVGGDGGYGYSDDTGSPNGVQKVVLKSSDQNKAKALVKGKGANLPDLDLGAITTPVTAQLVNDEDTVCFEGTYDLADVIKSDAGMFKAKY